MKSPLQIDHYTDVLCIWAWIAQRRVDEIEAKWGDQVVIKHHCVDVFGDTANRIGRKWSDRGAYAGFATHVQESAAPYETAPVSPDIWNVVRPHTSATAHLILKAIEIIAGPQDAREFSVDLRRGFFAEALDIGNLDVLLEIAVAAGFKGTDLMSTIVSGRALGALMADYELAQEFGIKGSPTWVLNNGRQVLFGNVGFRVLDANIEELLKSPDHEASWC